MQDNLQKEGYTIENLEDAIEIYNPYGLLSGVIFKKKNTLDNSSEALSAT